MPGPKIELGKIHFRSSPKSPDTFCGIRMRPGERYSVVVPSLDYIKNNIGAPICRTCFRIFEQESRETTV